MSCCPEALNDGRTPGSGPASIPGAAGYELAARVLFDAATQALADGAQVIDGVTFTVVNSASAATWQTTLGTGLQFRAAAVSTQWVTAGGGQSAAALRVRWRDLVDDYDPTRRYLVQVLLDASDANAASERVAVGVIREAGVPTGANRAISGAFHGHNGTAVMAGTIASNSAGTGSVDYAAVPCELSWSASPSSPSGAVGHYAPQAAGDWAPQSDLRTLTWTQATGTPGAITADAFTDPDAEVFLAFPTGNVTGTFNATVRELRVLVAA